MSARWRAARRDLALAYDAMQGHDPDDPAVAPTARREPVVPLLDRGSEGLRVAVAGGYFKCRRPRKRSMPSTAWRRRSAPIATSRFRRRSARARPPSSSPPAKAASLHLDRLRTRAKDFDPAVRDRLIAGAMLPASLVVKAQKFRRWYRGEVLKLFAEVDAILAPATPCTAPLIGQQTFKLGDVEMPVRANLGLYTQPISFIGLPVVAVPVPLSRCRSPSRSSPRHGARTWRCASRMGSKRRVSPQRCARLFNPLVSTHWRESNGDRPAGGRCRRYEPSSTVTRRRWVETTWRRSTRYSTKIAHHPLRRHRKPIRLRGDQSVSRRALAGRLARTMSKTVITTYGRDHAVASTLFHRAICPAKSGRQMQTWVRFPEGWRVVAAHVSFIDEPK